MLGRDQIVFRLALFMVVGLALQPAVKYLADITGIGGEGFKYNIIVLIYIFSFIAFILISNISRLSVFRIALNILADLVILNTIYFVFRERIGEFLVLTSVIPVILVFSFCFLLFF